MPENYEPFDPDPPAPASEATALQLRDPGVPATLNDLAALRGEAIEVLDARVLILETARKRAIRMTHPEDWVLFQSPDGRVTGYLQDAGCDRVRDVLGVEVFNLSAPEKITAADGQSFTYIVTGDGRSRLTMQGVEAMEGGRSSGDDFARGKTGADLELLVRKAARANLDGNITRELTGLKAVPLGVLIEAWQSTGKNADHCRRGRGFGSQAERLGATREGDPDVAPPTCPVCKLPNGAPLPLKYRAASGTRAAFYGCPNYGKHPQQKVIIDAAQWIAKAPKADEAEQNRRFDAELAEPGANG